MRKTTEEIIAEARGILAQGYCSKENEKKEVDADLLLAQADLLEAFLKQALKAKDKAHKQEMKEKTIEIVILSSSIDQLNMVIKAKNKTMKAMKKQIIDELKMIDSEKWNDAVHCTCLGYAIDYLERGQSYKERHCEELETKMDA